MILHHRGFPIRKSADITLIYNSPQLIAVNRVLLRLLMPRHSPYALVRLNFPMLFSCSELYEFHLNMVIYSSWKGDLAFFWMFLPPCNCLLRWNCSYYPNIGKTLNFDWSRYLMSSISVRFNSFLFSYSIFNEHKCRQLADWSVWMDSNHRPRAYQARALATWATNRFTHRLWFFHHASLSFTFFSVSPSLWRVKSEEWKVKR